MTKDHGRNEFGRILEKEYCPVLELNHHQFEGRNLVGLPPETWTVDVSLNACEKCQSQKGVIYERKPPILHPNCKCVLYKHTMGRKQEEIGFNPLTTGIEPNSKSERNILAFGGIGLKLKSNNIYLCTVSIICKEISDQYWVTTNSLFLSPTLCTIAPLGRATEHFGSNYDDILKNWFFEISVVAGDNYFVLASLVFDTFTSINTVVDSWDPWRGPTLSPAGSYSLNQSKYIEFV